MKKLIAICLVCIMLVGVSGCAPFNVKFNIYESNRYTFANDSSESNKVWNASYNDEAARAYGNNNRVIIHQSNVMYKSPMTNSSNEFSATLPLIK